MIYDLKLMDYLIEHVVLLLWDLTGINMGDKSQHCRLPHYFHGKTQCISYKLTDWLEVWHCAFVNIKVSSSNERGKFATITAMTVLISLWLNCNTNYCSKYNSNIFFETSEKWSTSENEMSQRWLKSCWESFVNILRTSGHAILKVFDYQAYFKATNWHSILVSKYWDVPCMYWQFYLECTSIHAYPSWLCQDIYDWISVANCQ